MHILHFTTFNNLMTAVTRADRHTEDSVAGQEMQSHAEMLAPWAS